MNPHDVGLKINMIVVDSANNPQDNLAAELKEYADVMKIFKSSDGKIFVKALSPVNCTEEECLKQLKTRLYGYNYSIHAVDEVVKYEHKIHDELIDGIE